MTDANHDNDHARSTDDGARDVLLTRIIDGRADADEWDSFRRLAANDETVWADLRALQHDHDALVHAVDAAMARADDIELPPHAPAAAVAGSRAAISSRWVGGLGWAAAAAIALAWVGIGVPAMTTPDDPDHPGTTQTAGPHPRGERLADTADPADAGVTMDTGGGDLMGDVMLTASDRPGRALDAYLTRGRAEGLVVGELPERPLVRTSRLPDGQLEVLWVRQILERSVLPATYRTTTDEFGNPVAHPVEIRQTGMSRGVH